MFDFLNDKRLELEECGLLAHIVAGPDNDPTARRLKDCSPAGRDKVARIVKGLVNAGYLQVHRSPRQPNSYSFRGCLAEAFKPWGEQEALALAATEPELVEAELLEPEPVVELQVQKKGRPKSQSKTLEEKAKGRPDFENLVIAYRQMLKEKRKPNNFGQKNAAAREFGKLLPEIERDPNLIVKIIESLKGYSIISQGYPLGLAKYLSNRVWESVEEDLEALNHDDIEWG